MLTSLICMRMILSFSFFFFKQKTAYEMRISDWSSDVCSSDLALMPIAPALVVQACQLLARSAGSMGMVGGQAIDCGSVGMALDDAQLQQMHSMKTGALLGASVLLGGVVAGAGSSARQGLEVYASAVGLAFQVVDDILDVTSDPATLGKTAGKEDRKSRVWGKSVYERVEPGS